jgi:DNA-binding transcriptional ArsR family regulator
MDAVLGAIAEPNRRAILQLVGQHEMAAGEIAAQFAVTRPAVSQHLTVLKDAGLLVERREGTRRLYRLRPEGLAELRAFLTELWPNALERFKAAAEATAITQTSGPAALGHAPTITPRDKPAGRRRPTIP